MKNLLLFLTLTFLSIFSQAQTRQLPDYLIEKGDTIGIVLSIEQAQKLDNNTELLQLFKQLQIDCDNLEGYYVSIINESNQQIALLEANITSLTLQGQDKDKLIENLEKQLSNCAKDTVLCNQELKNKNDEIKLLKADLRKEKFKKWMSAGLNAVQMAAVVFLLTKL
jgi:NACalpha-BTF3-like transcription factor